MPGPGSGGNHDWCSAVLVLHQTSKDHCERCGGPTPTPSRHPRRSDSYPARCARDRRGDTLAASQLAEILDLAVWLLDPATCILDGDRFCPRHRLS